MPRAFSPTALRAGAALGLVLALTARSPGQTTIFNSNGFDSGYIPSFIFNQGGFTNFLPSLTAGMIQNSTVHSGTQAFQAVASQMQPNPAYAGGNFWWRTENYDTTPTRYLQVSF